MTNYGKLLMLYELLGKLIESEYEILLRDQLQLQAYSSKPGASMELINATQSKLNERFDLYENIKSIYGQLPDLVDGSISDSEEILRKKKDTRIRELEDLVSRMEKLEMVLLDERFIIRYGKNYRNIGKRL